MNCATFASVNRLRAWLCILLLMVPAFTDAVTPPLVWQTSRSAAISLAQAQGKIILLISGRPLCGNCSYMKNTVCEMTTPYNILSHGSEHTQQLAAWLKEHYIDHGKLGVASGEGFYRYDKTPN